MNCRSSWKIYSTQIFLIFYKISIDSVPLVLDKYLEFFQYSISIEALMFQIDVRLFFTSNENIEYSLKAV